MIDLLRWGFILLCFLTAKLVSGFGSSALCSTLYQQKNVQGSRCKLASFTCPVLVHFHLVLKHQPPRVAGTEVAQMYSTKQLFGGKG